MNTSLAFQILKLPSKANQKDLILQYQSIMQDITMSSGTANEERRKLVEEAYQSLLFILTDKEEKQAEQAQIISDFFEKKNSPSANTIQIDLDLEERYIDSFIYNNTVNKRSMARETSIMVVCATIMGILSCIFGYRELIVIKLPFYALCAIIAAIGILVFFVAKHFMIRYYDDWKIATIFVTMIGGTPTMTSALLHLNNMLPLSEYHEIQQLDYMGYYGFGKTTTYGLMHLKNGIYDEYSHFRHVDFREERQEVHYHFKVGLLGVHYLDYFYIDPNFVMRKKDLYNVAFNK